MILVIFRFHHVVFNLDLAMNLYWSMSSYLNGGDGPDGQIAFGGGTQTAMYFLVVFVDDPINLYSHQLKTTTSNY